MPPRLPPLHSLLRLQAPQCCPYVLIRRSFRTTTPHYQHDSPPNHYETLGLQPDASAADIKRQFYTLSKRHHPDVNPNDASASERFVQISEAYATLGSAEKRSRYDRDFVRTQQQSSSYRRAYPPGSHSSSQTSAAGGRPASGLSRRRTTFRGPPPSFYQQGGWGRHGAKRAGSAPGSGGAASGAGGASEGGFSPGQHAYEEEYSNPDIPHWNREGHFRTHEGIRMRREGRSRGVDERDYVGRENMVMDFATVTGVLVAIFGVPVMLYGVFGGSTSKGKREKTAKGNG